MKIKTVLKIAKTLNKIGIYPMMELVTRETTIQSSNWRTFEGTEYGRIKILGIWFGRKL